MELILISDTKLKVMLSALDMQKYDLDNDSIDYDNTETRRAFWQILDEAKHKTGFDAASEKVFIQVYPSRGGGCEMYVTKLGALSSALPEEAISRKTSFSMLRGKIGIYHFDSIEDVITVCRRLKSSGYSSESGLYASENGGYDLVIHERLQNSIMNSSSVSEYSFIEEYAKRKRGTLELAYIKEHGECIEALAAVEKLSSV
ncbi:MAG: adaptor protein MecA [Clostridia bacterium]|jgi:negative regulator of genetic competence, sporulation and motility|nr:adaptor protein MecA [Clostridia bacterium]